MNISFLLPHSPLNQIFSVIDFQTFLTLTNEWRSVTSAFKHHATVSASIFLVRPQFNRLSGNHLHFESELWSLLVGILFWLVRILSGRHLLNFLALIADFNSGNSHSCGVNCPHLPITVLAPAVALASLCAHRPFHPCSPKFLWTHGLCSIS